MNISERIQSMYENVGEVYDTITNVDLPTNKNIENIPSTIRKSYLDIMNNGIDTIYDNWEKVNGTGTSITLNNTEEAPMTIEYKGNTSQETTTGKNKYNATRSSATTNAVTYSGDTSKIYINGTPNGTGRIFFNKTYLEAGTYTFSATLSKGSFTNGGNNLTYLYLYKGTETTASWDFVTRILLTATIGNVVSATFTISEGSYYYLSWYLDTSYTWTNAEIKYQVESGSSFTSFEPYTNGASPNPQYPQDIHIVSGDNYINVVGKNLLSMEDSTRTYTGGISVTTTNNTRIIFNGTATATYYTSNLLEYELQPGTYTISGTNSNRKYYFWFRDDENNTIGNVHINGTNSATFTHPSKTTKLAVGIEGLTTGTSYNEITDIQLEKGNQVTDFQPYQSASYPISLGVENLFDLTTAYHGTINAQGVEGPNESFRTTTYINSYPNTNYYLYTTQISGQSNKQIYIAYYDSNKTFLSRDSYNELAHLFTTPSNCYYIRAGVYTAMQENIQLTKGSTKQAISTTPIELCKIGTYQDRIFKSSGKNLFNPATETKNYIVNSEGTLTPNNSYNSSAFIPMQPLTNVVLSTDQTSAILEIVEYDTNQSLINRGVKTNSTFYNLKTSNTTAYIRISYQNTSTKVQFEKGSTATTYEPYGKDWYLNKQIGKVVLNGSESGWHTSSLVVTGYKSYYVDSSVRINQDALGSKCNYFEYKTYNEWQSLLKATFIENTYQAIGIRVVETLAPTLEDFKTWLSTHNTIAYFVLATPTYEKITRELLNQLEAIKNSYENQTNINQENNDLPFELEVGALEKL